MEYPGLERFLADRPNTTGWSLCVGAGISKPIFPDWSSLVQRLMARLHTPAAAAKMASSLLRTFSPDALIEAARQRAGFTDEEFGTLLSEELYADVRSLLLKPDFELFCRVLFSVEPGAVTKPEWLAFLSIIRRHCQGSSGWPIAELLSRLVDTALAPASILSFNAEPLLAALINGLRFERYVDRGVPHPVTGELKRTIDLVTHSISGRRADRIPYVFCHGLLSPPKPIKLAPSSANATDKLVFSETAYLELANSVFSWQSAVFLDACSSRPVVFVGVSLSDPNMRRWLTWVHQNRLAELAAKYGFEGDSTTHYWIKKTPSDQAERDWLEAVVSHLGVRLIWIPSWDLSGMALAKLLGA